MSSVLDDGTCIDGLREMLGEDGYDELRAWLEMDWPKYPFAQKPSPTGRDL